MDPVSPPLLTVVIPAWGSYAGSLEHALSSAAHPRVHRLVVDNASDPPLTSTSPVEILRLEERVSLGQARNAALARITTPYVLFCDADDHLLPGAIDHLLQRAHTHGPAPVLVAARLADPESGAEYHWPRAWQRRLTHHRRLFALAEAVRPAFPVQGSLLPTHAVRSCGGYPAHDDAAEDWVLGVSLALRCLVRFAHAPTMSYTPAPSGRWTASARLRSQLAHRAHVRARLKTDPAAAHLRVWLPLLALAHLLGALRERLAFLARR